MKYSELKTIGGTVRIYNNGGIAFKGKHKQKWVILKSGKRNRRMTTRKHLRAVS